MKSTQIQSQHFDIEHYLQQLCKRQPIYDETQQEKYQIDFLALEKDLIKIQGVQQRTCEQVVEFVDQHRERFIKINQKLDQIESKVRRSENILKMVGSRIDDYKSEYYNTESKIQKCINEYEMKLLKDQVLELAKSEAQFLSNFNKQFQSITSKRIQILSYSDKHLISRFTYKMNFLKNLYSYHIVKELVLQALDISEIVTHLQEQLQLYLSEQLSRVQEFCNSSVGSEQIKINDALDLIKAWYINISKKQQYYRVIQKNTIEKQMQSSQKLLISNKTSLLSGKDHHIMENVFTKILNSITSCPHNHPRQRLKNIIFSFFKKQELKFLYTYAMPIFPLAYRSYLAAIQKSGIQPQLKKYMQEHNGWNLKMWMQVRQKNIFDRSNNDNDMLKWIDIVFKSSCMLPGSLPYFTKLIFKIINRYISRIINTELVASSFNKLVQQSNTVPQALKQKLIEVNPNCREMAQKAVRCLKTQFQKTIQQILIKNLHNICSSCQSCLEPIKSFVSKIIKKDKEFIQSNTINKEQNIFKPLHAFLKNNAEMEPHSVAYIQKFVTKTLVKYYDTHYVPQIFSYAKDHLISDQVSLVMEVIGRERTVIFNTEQQN